MQPPRKGDRVACLIVLQTARVYHFQFLGFVVYFVVCGRRLLNYIVLSVVKTILGSVKYVS
jgi:hypothetical protein